MTAVGATAFVISTATAGLRDLEATHGLCIDNNCGMFVFHWSTKG